MDKAEVVTVYAFQQYDAMKKAFVIAPFKVPRKLVSKFGGRLLEGTAEDVSVTDLNHRGEYRRIATGWRELPDDDAPDTCIG